MFLQHCRSGTSVCSSEGSPTKLGSTVNNLEDYQGRHAPSSPHKTTSAGTATMSFDAVHGQNGASHPDWTDLKSHAERDPQHAQQTKHAQRRSSLWGSESFTAQPLSKAGTMQSQDVARRQTDASLDSKQAAAAGLIRSKSSVPQHSLHMEHAVPHRQQSAVSWTEAQTEPSHQPYPAKARSPVTKHPSRLQQSGFAAFAESDATHISAPHLPSTEDSSSTDQEELQHRRRQNRHQQQQNMQSMQSRGAATSPRSPKTAEEYMRRAGFRTHQQSAEFRTSQQDLGQKPKGPSRSPPYAAKARILDLHDGCTLAGVEQTLSGSREYSPARWGRRDGQGGAGVCLGGTHMKLAGRCFASSSRLCWLCRFVHRACTVMSHIRESPCHNFPGAYNSP